MIDKGNGYQCEQDFVKSYVESILPNLGNQYTGVADVVAKTLQVAVEVAAVATRYFVDGQNGLFTEIATFNTLRPKIFLGSLTLSLFADAATAAHAARAGVANQWVSGVQESLFLGSWFDVDALSGNVINIPFIVFSSLIVTNGGGGGDVLFDAKFDGWVVTLK